MEPQGKACAVCGMPAESEKETHYRNHILESAYGLTVAVIEKGLLMERIATARKALQEAGFPFPCAECGVDVPVDSRAVYLLVREPSTWQDPVLIVHDGACETTVARRCNVMGKAVIE